MSVLGVGYATPLLRPFLEEAERVVTVMPARQGVVRWPLEGANLAVLSEESELPFQDLSLDRVVLAHAVESTEQLRPMMREVWRVLAASGRVIVVVPNRRGLWARIERTPLANGQPYSVSQLNRMLRDAMFMPSQSAQALFVPPTRSRMLLSSAEAWEEAGGRWFPLFGGVVIVEAMKQIYAAAEPTPTRATGRVRAPARGGVIPGAPGRKQESSDAHYSAAWGSSTSTLSGSRPVFSRASAMIV